MRYGGEKTICKWAVDWYSCEETIRKCGLRYSSEETSCKYSVDWWKYMYINIK